MTTNSTQHTCFNCGRSEMEIPVIVWSYQERPLSVCSECMPLLIHKWGQVVAQLSNHPPRESDE